MEFNAFDLTDPIEVDTFLVVKMDKFVRYIIKKNRSDGSQRTYGDLYNYFTNEKQFKFAIGYMLVDRNSEYYEASVQYFYFDKNKLPHKSFKKLNCVLKHSKKRS